MNKRQWLIDKRKEKGIEQQQLAKEVGITPQYLYFIEHDQRKPSTDLAKKIADILNFSWTKFFE